MKRFLSMFRAEHYKTRGNIAILLFLLCPLVVIAYACIQIAIKTGNTEIVGNPWVTLLFRKLTILYLFYPFLVSILTYSLCDMEYRNRNFKRLFTLPYPVHTIYTSKVVFLIEIVFLSTLIAFVSFIAGGFVLSKFFPALSFHDYDIRFVCLIFHTHLFISLLAVSLIQYSISLIFKNFVIPVGFGCFMFVFTFVKVVLKPTKYDYLNPFAAYFNSVNEFEVLNTSFSKYDYVCFAWIFVFLFINYFIFKLQKTK